MKRYIFIFAASIFLLAINAFGQETVNGEIPSIVVNNFEMNYAKATDVKWKVESDLYRVEFELEDDLDQKNWYDSSSKIVKQEVEIAKTDLPAAILSKIKTEFKGYKIDEAEKITSDSNIRYSVELEAFMKKDWKITFNTNGSILHQVAD